MANDQEIGKLVIRLVAEIKDVKKQLVEVQQDTKTFADTSKKHAGTFSESIAGIKTAYLKAAAEIYVAYKLISKAMEFLEVGAKAKQTEDAFLSLTRSMGVNGNELIRQMKEMGFTFVDQISLMIKAQRLLVEGVDPKDIIGLMEASRVAARLMGTDVSDAFERISESIITLRTRGIKAAFPMDVVEVTDRYATSLNTVSKYLSEAGQRQAIINEILRQKIEKKSFLGIVLEPTTSEELEKVGSAFGELKEIVGKLMEELVRGGKILPMVIDIIARIGEGLNELKVFKDEFGLIFAAVEVGLKTVLIGVMGFFVGVTAIYAGLMEINHELLALINFVTLGAIPGMSKAVEDFGKRKEKVFDSLTRQADALNRIMFGGEVKTPMAKAAPGKLGEVPKKQQKDLKKLEDDLTKFRLANEEQRVTSQNEIIKTGLETRKIIEITEAKKRGQDVTLIEMQWNRVLADEELRATKEVLAIRERAELEAAKQAGMDRADVEKKYQVLRLAAEKKNILDITKINSEAELYARQVAIDREKAMADYNKQLAEISGNYDSITEAQVRSLEVEREAFKISDQWGKLLPEQQAFYINMMDQRIAKLREVRALESMKETAEWRGQLGELTGNWIMMKDAQLESLRVEKEITLATEGLTDAQRELINAVYARREAEIAAQRDMDVQTLMEIGRRQEVINLNTQLADTYANLLPNTINVAGNALSTFLNNLADGTMSVGDAIRQLGMDFAKSVRQMMIDILMLIIRMQILKALSSVIPGLGGAGAFSWGGTAQNFETGGRISGPKGKDVVPIRATVGEYMQPVPAVRYYGLEAMEAIRRMRIPREMFAGLGIPSIHRPIRGFQEGGAVSGVGGQGQGKTEINLFNIVGEDAILQALASSAGQSAVVNIIGANAGTIKRRLR